MKNQLLAAALAAVALAGCAGRTEVPGEQSSLAESSSIQDTPPASKPDQPAAQAGDVVAPDTNALNAIARENIPEFDEPIAFTDQVICDLLEHYQVFRTTGIMNYNTILLREKDSGTWHGVSLGEYGVQAIKKVWEDPETPGGVLFTVDGYQFGGDYLFQDFMRTLRYDISAKELTVKTYENRFADGTYGFLKNGETVNMNLLSVDNNSAVLDFQLPGVPIANGYRCPEMDLSREHVSPPDSPEGDIYTLYFKNTQNNLTEEQLTRLRGLSGVTDVQVRSVDDAALKGTILTISMDWPYVLKYTFRIDRQQIDPFQSFVLESVLDKTLS